MKRLFFTISIISLCFLFSCGELPETFKVIYHGTGSDYGTPPVDNNEYKSGEYAIVLDKGTLIKGESTFDGWDTKQDGTGERYKPGEQIKIENITIFLFATWR
ncbi:MAG: hypothetical protein LBC52_06810 [Treponema sp.]|jgi:hypothetical protein|nr:hypothetical protein [Treponema sp.]